LNRSTCFALGNQRAAPHLISLQDILDTKMDEVAASELAIDCEIEQRQVAGPV
jgi:hypothetical protein